MRRLYDRSFWLVGLVLWVSASGYSQSWKTSCPVDILSNRNLCYLGSLGRSRDNSLNSRRVFSGVELPGNGSGIGRYPWTGTFNLSVPGALRIQNQDYSPAGQKESWKEQQSTSPKASGSPGHIFWVVPAFKVEYGKDFKPLTPKEKFGEWARGAYDPLGLGAGAVEAATLEHSSTDGFCGYGHGWVGYGKCFGAQELDANISSFIGDFALTTLMHQDPRYFRLGRGSFGSRLWYAVSRVFVTYNDSGQTVFYSSALAGTAAAGGISNLYYPKQDRGLGHSLSRIGLDLGNTALYNAAAEFWPDINHKLHQIF